MQVPYYTEVSLQKYYMLFWAAKWDIPDFSDKCLICGGEDCAKYHGCYTRTVKCPLTGFYADDFPIIRIFCHGKGTEIKCDHVTFSLLPLDLIPFRQLTLQFMVLAVWLRLIQGLSLTKSADAIEDMVVNLGDIATFVTNAAQLEWKNIIKIAFSRFISGNVSILNDEDYSIIKDDHEKGFFVFLKLAIEYKSQFIGPSIRGPGALAWDYYKITGKDPPLFLFGTASQHRS